MCGYYNLGGNHSWTRKTGSTPSSRTGPRRDHTTGLGKTHSSSVKPCFHIRSKSSVQNILSLYIGWYMYTEASNFQRGVAARLSSPTLYNISCVTFYYHMFGSQIGTFNVYQVVEGNYTRVFQLKGNQGNRWYKREIPLQYVGNVYNISVSQCPL